MTLLVSAVVLVAVGLPHVAGLARVPSVIAVIIWVSALALRALGALFAIGFVALFLPASELYRAVTQWCWHAVLPLGATHLGLSGHRVGDAVVIVPVAVIAASLLWVLWALCRTDRAVRAMVRGRALGPGPAGSVMIGGSQVVVAVAGLSQPRVVVSAGALTVLDDAELAASLEHERGHIVRRHRYLLLFAEICRALARFLPGTHAAARELAFHLERDADEYALAHQHDPLALASAICKAATLTPCAGPAFAGLGGDGVAARLRILAEPPPQPRGSTRRAGRLAAIAMIVLSISLAAALPPALAQGIRQLASTPSGPTCPA